MKNNKEEQIIESLKLALNEKLEIFSWDINQKNRLIKANLFFTKIDIQKNKIFLIPAPESLYYLKLMIKGCGFLKIYLPKLALAFESEILEFHSEESLCLKFPKSYKFYDKREDDRVYTSSDLSIKFTVANTSISLKCDDLSSGGCSVFTTKMQAVSLISGSELKDCKLIMGNTSINIDLYIKEVLSIKNHEYERSPYLDKRISISFIDLSEENQKVINNFVHYQKKLLSGMA